MLCTMTTLFYLSLQPQHTNVCFWFLPPSLRGMPESEEKREKLHKVKENLLSVFMCF